MIYPADISELVSGNHEFLSDSAFYPYDWNINFQIELDIKNAFNEIIARTNSSIIQNALKINYYDHFNYVKLLQSLYLIESLKSHGLQPASSNSSYFQNLLESGVPGSYFSVKAQMGQNNSYRKLKKNIKYNFYLKPIRLSRNACIVTGTFSALTLEYIKTVRKNRILWKPVEEWYNYGKPDDNFSYLTKNENNALISVINEYLKEVENIGKNYGLKLSRKLLDDLSVKALFSYQKILILYHFLEHKIDDPGAKELFIGSNNSIPLRVLSSIVLESGGKVIGFNHGNPFWYKFDHVYWLELLLNSDFYAPNTNSAKALSKNISDLNVSSINRCRIGGFNSSYFNLKQENNLLKKDKIRRGDKVMVVGAPFNKKEYNHQYYLPDLVHLQFIRKLLKVLKALSYTTVYQKHPGVNIDFNKIMEFEDVKISTAPFEESMNEVNKILFIHLRTTTISEALCTNNKTIIYMDGGWEPVYDNMYTLFEKRCNIVKCKKDSNNLLTFSQDELRSAMEDNTKDCNNEFFNTYMSIL